MTGFALMHINLRTLCANIDQLRDYEYNAKAIGESWLSPSAPNEAVYIHGYNIIHLDRLSHGSAVTPFVRNFFYFVLLDCNV